VSLTPDEPIQRRQDADNSRASVVPRGGGLRTAPGVTLQGVTPELNKKNCG